MRAPLSRWQVLRAAVRAWWEGGAFQMAAALAYYAIVSMAPLLLLAVGFTRYVLGEQLATGELARRMKIMVGADAADAIQAILGNIQALGSDNLITGVNLIVFLFGSVWVFVNIQDALNTIWKASGTEGVGGALRMRARLLLFPLVLCTGLLLLTMLAASVTLVTLANSLETSRFSSVLLHGLNLGLSFILVALVFALIYRYVPDAPVEWRDVRAGALGSSLLHSVGNYAIGLYVGNSLLTSIYGAASSVVFILLWVYYSSLGFLLGAEYVHQCARQRMADRARREAAGAAVGGEEGPDKPLAKPAGWLPGNDRPG
jgi:membrane protein